MKTNVCSKCGKITRTIRSYERHMQVHIIKYRYTCSLCEKGYNKAHHLADHYRIQHEHEGNFYVCRICAKDFANKSGLDEHVTIFHRKKHKFVCLQCGLHLCTQYSLNQHMQIHSRRDWKCPTCQKAFNQSQQLDRHVRDHHTVRCPDTMQ